VPTPSWYVRGEVGYAWMDANDLVARIGLRYDLR